MRLFLSSALLFALLLPPAAPPAEAYRPGVRRIDHFFRIKGFERDGDGYRVTLENLSRKGFSGFLIVFLGTDIDRIDVYRREIYVDAFMEGKSERTFFLPGHDDRVLRFDIRVFDRNPLYDLEKRPGDAP